MTTITPPITRPARARAGNGPQGQPIMVCRAGIERDARRAAQAGVLLRDACPYPWGTEAEEHFTAVFMIAGGRVHR